MNKHDQKKQLRRHKRQVKQLGNQKERTKAKRLLQQDPTSDQLMEDPNYGKLTSSGLNGLDVDKTRNTTHHQQYAQEPALDPLDALEVAAVGLEVVATVLDLVAAVGDASA